MYIYACVSIKIQANQSNIPVKGNAMASGDDKYDRKVENQILKRLENGDIAAWFDVVVTVTIEWDDLEYSAYDSLGACSYNSIKEFVKQIDGYYGDMLETAWDTVIYDIGLDLGDDTANQIVKPDLTKIKPVICEC